jgi:hypothetical protein
MTLVSRMRSAAALAAAGVALALVACGGDDEAGPVPEEASSSPPAGSTAAPAPEPAPEPTPEPAPEPEPLPGLPRYTAGFPAWERINARPIPPDSAQTRRVGFDAHRGTKNVHVNQPLRRLRGPDGGQRLPYPDGTILVKAARGGEGLTLVAVMRKIQGVDPAHGDWEFVEYKRSGDGEPFTTGPGLTGETCWGCHAVAEDTDWVFTPLDR